MYTPPQTKIGLAYARNGSEVDSLLVVNSAMVVRSTGYHQSGQPSVKYTVHFRMDTDILTLLQEIELRALDRKPFTLALGNQEPVEVTIDSMTCIPLTSACQACVISVTVMEEEELSLMGQLFAPLKNLFGWYAKRKG